MGAILVANMGLVLLDGDAVSALNLKLASSNSSTTKFRIASLTKQFTAVAILLLEGISNLK